MREHERRGFARVATWTPADFPARDLVCFASAFAYESALNITHATLDGERTLCGRKNWETSEGWHEDALPDCLRCRRSLAKLDRQS